MLPIIPIVNLKLADRKHLKRLVKMYRKENCALADEAIAYKMRAEKAEDEIIRLKCESGKLRYAGDVIIGIGNDFEFLANDRRLSEQWNLARIEWQKSKEL